MLYKTKTIEMPCCQYRAAIPESHYTIYKCYVCGTSWKIIMEEQENKEFEVIWVERIDSTGKDLLVETSE